MSLYILALNALVPFALIAFLWREAHIDLRQALLFFAADVALLMVVAVTLLEL
jgi:hypothetical protein